MLTSTLMFILISNALTLKRDLSVLFSRVVAIVFSLISVSCIYILTIKPLQKSVGLYGGLFHTSSFTQSMHLFFILISGIILLFTGFYPRKVYVKQYSSIYNLIIYKFNYNQSKILNNMSEQYTLIEYSLIVIFIICGGVFLISTSNYISLFLAIELQSYGLYIICSLYRDSESATSGGLTYFLLGGLSSCFILLATSLLYTNSGTTYLDELYVISNLSDISTNLYLILNC
jgi:NADH-ubiquinone oxidoreductase chain 2